MLGIDGESYVGEQDQTFDDQQATWDHPCYMYVIPDFKDKIRYAPYVSFRSQISHIATNKE